MYKNITIIVLVVLLAFSLFANYYFLSSLVPDYLSEENRLKQTGGLLYTFGNFQRNDEQNKTSENYPFLDTAKMVLDNLNMLQDGVIGNSGGLNVQTGEYMNAYGRTYVQRFFYEDNNFNPHALQLFQRTIDSYLTTVKEYNINSQLPRNIEFQKNYYPDILKKLTVSETVVLLDLIKIHVLSDKYEFLLQNKNNAY